MTNSRILTCLLVICFAVPATAQSDKKPANTDAKAAAAAAAMAAAKKSLMQKQQQKEPAAPKERTEEETGSTIEKASFLIGFNMISRLKQQDAEFNYDKIIAGLAAAKEGKESGMTREEQRSILMAYNQINVEKKNAKTEALAKTNGAEGEKLMAEFAKQEGAKELEDGVMYMVMKEGDGEIPEAPDRVRLHYKGTFADGEVFDSSYDRGEPIVSNVLGFVPGFTKALQAMKVGSKWKVAIRGDKAYGMRGRGKIEVNKTLQFEIELLEIMPVK